ncbi:hypothetical protein EMMF5_003768 [Cystobasidiomycetes sp. EMM_F5]
MAPFSGSGNSSPNHGDGSSAGSDDADTASSAVEPEIPRFVLSPASLAIHDEQQHEASPRIVYERSNDRLRLTKSPQRLSTSAYSVEAGLDPTHADLDSLSAYSVEDRDNGQDYRDDGNERDDEASEDGHDDTESDFDRLASPLRERPTRWDGSMHLSTSPPPTLRRKKSVQDPFFDAVEASFICTTKPACSRTRLVSCLSGRATSPGPMSPLLSDDDWPSSSSAAASSLISAVFSSGTDRTPSLSSSPDSTTLAQPDSEMPRQDEADASFNKSGYESACSSSSSFSSGGTSRVRFKSGCVISEVNLTWAAQSYDRAPIDVAQSLDMHRCHSLDVDGGDADEDAETWQCEDEENDEQRREAHDAKSTGKRDSSDENDEEWSSDPLAQREHEERVQRSPSPSSSYTSISDNLSLCRIASRATSYPSPFSRTTPLELECGDDIDEEEEDDEGADARTILSVSPAAPGTLLSATLHDNDPVSFAPQPPSPPLSSSRSTAAAAAFACARATMEDNLTFHQHPHAQPAEEALSFDDDEPTTSPVLPILSTDMVSTAPLSVSPTAYDESSASSCGEQDDAASKGWASWMKMACLRKKAALAQRQASEESRQTSTLSDGALESGPCLPGRRRSSASTSGASDQEVQSDTAQSGGSRQAKSRRGMCAMGKFSREQLFECDALGGF